MNKTQDALKLALEAFDYIEHNYMSLPAPATKAITAIRSALAEQPLCKYPHCSYPCPDLPDCRDAEQPAPVAEPHKQQEPVDTDWDAVLEKLIEVWNRQISADEGLDEIQDLIYTSPPANANAGKPWVGLTDEDFNTNMFSITSLGVCDIASMKSIAKDVEAKLREKNT